jgi:hypothetical protein
MENLQPHKNSNVRELTDAAGPTLRQLLVCSRDLNPIEQASAKPKSICVS